MEQSNVAHRCALCSEAIQCDMELVESYVSASEAHHAVCPKRPIAVGDEVRIVRTSTARLHGTVGKVVHVERSGHMPYRVKVDGDSFAWWCYEVERIPRPTETQATIRTPVGDIKIIADPTLKPGEFRVEEQKYHPVVVDKAMMERAMKDERLMQRLQEETEKRVQWLATSGTQVHTLEPSPALIDGLTRERCLVQWLQNRLAVEGGAVPPNAMTRMQRDVGHAMWLAGPGAKWSAELRAKVAEDREAERCRVRVEVQDVE